MDLWCTLEGEVALCYMCHRIEKGTYFVLKRVIIQIVCLQIEGRKYSIKFENNEPFQIERLNFTKC